MWLIKENLPCRKQNKKEIKKNNRKTYVHYSLCRLHAWDGSKNMNRNIFTGKPTLIGKKNLKQLKPLSIYDSRRKKEQISWSNTTPQRSSLSNIGQSADLKHPPSLKSFKRENKKIELDKLTTHSKTWSENEISIYSYTSRFRRCILFWTARRFPQKWLSSRKSADLEHDHRVRARGTATENSCCDWQTKLSVKLRTFDDGVCVWTSKSRSCSSV